MKRAKIIEVAKRSESYAEAGRELGISRERVRQVAGHFIKLKFEGLESLTELARRYNYTQYYFRQLVKVRSIPGKKIAGKWYVKVGLELDFGSCELCKKPLGKRRLRYCSEGCLKEARKKSHERSSWRRFKRLKGQRIGTDLRLWGHESFRLLKLRPSLKS